MLPSTGKAALLCLVVIFSMTGCLTPLTSRHAGGAATNPATSDQRGTTGQKHTAESLEQQLQDNPLFKDPDLGLEQQDCEFHDPSPQGYATDARQYITDEYQCMEKAWKRPIKAVAAHVMDDPTINFPSQYPYTSSCHDHVEFTPDVCLDSVFFQINDPVYQNSDGKLDLYPTFQDVLIAHSIWLTQAFGIWGAEQDAEQKHGSASAEAGELNKRLVLTQICLGGLYLVAQYKNNASAEGFFTDFLHHTHKATNPSEPGTAKNPSPQHSLDWLLKGVNTNKVAACNAWTAPATEVS